MKPFKLLKSSDDKRALRTLRTNPALRDAASHELAEVRALFRRGRPAVPVVIVAAATGALPDAAVIAFGSTLVFISARVRPRYIVSALCELAKKHPGIAGEVKGQGWVICARFRRASQSHRAARALARRLVFLSAQRGPAAAISISNID